MQDIIFEIVLFLSRYSRLDLVQSIYLEKENLCICRSSFVRLGVLP